MKDAERHSTAIRKKSSNIINGLAKVLASGDFNGDPVDPDDDEDMNFHLNPSFEPILYELANVSNQLHLPQPR